MIIFLSPVVSCIGRSLQDGSLSDLYTSTLHYRCSVSAACHVIPVLHHPTERASSLLKRELKLACRKKNNVCVRIYSDNRICIKLSV